MRVVNTILTFALVVILSVIAYDLHRIARFWAPTTLQVHAAPKLTREQERAQVQEGVRRTQELFDDITSTPPSQRQTPQTRATH